MQFRFNLTNRTIVSRKSTPQEIVNWLANNSLISGIPYSEAFFNNEDIKSLDEIVKIDMPITSEMSDVEAFSANFVSKLFSKIEVQLDGFDPEAEAIKEFEGYNFLARISNERINKLRVTENSSLQILNQRIEALFLQFDDYFMRSLSSARMRPLTYTSGAAIRCPRGSNVFHRLQHLGNAYPTKAIAWTEKTLCTDLDQFQVWVHVEGSDLEIFNYINAKTVAKTYKVARLIGTSSYDAKATQKLVGDGIRGVLQAYGLLKPNAQSIHQNVVKTLAWNNNVATYDIKGGSNGIALEVMSYFGPNLKQYVLNERVSGFRLQGENQDMHMLLPAGVGFTFELETLVFWIITLAVNGHKTLKLPEESGISVYGDDIIAPTNTRLTLFKVFSLFGIEINMEKSFYERNELESCGSHFRDGRTVKPPSVKDVSGLRAIFKAVNRIRERCYLDNNHAWISSAYSRLWTNLIESIRPEDRLFVPTRYGDAGINYDIEFTSYHVHEKFLARGCWIPKFYPYRVRSVCLDPLYDEEIEHGIKRDHTYALEIQVIEEKTDKQFTFGELHDRYGAETSLQACVHGSSSGGGYDNEGNYPKHYSGVKSRKSIYWRYVTFSSISQKSETPLEIFDVLSKNPSQNFLLMMRNALSRLNYSAGQLEYCYRVANQLDARRQALLAEAEEKELDEAILKEAESQMNDFENSFDDFEFI